MTVEIRAMGPQDIAGFDEILRQQPGRVDEPGYAQRSFEEHAAGNRVIFMAFLDSVPVGFIHLLWNPLYALFRRLGIPEIQDLAVIPSARQRGIGSRLVQKCEDEARAKGKTDIGIGVGLFSSYGAAQRLYVTRGYVPDGYGVVYDNQPVRGGDMRPVDDLLVLKMTKSL